MTPATLDEGERLLAAATRGPWKVTECMDYWIEHVQPLTPSDEGFSGIALAGEHDWPNSDLRQQEWRANAALIAWAHNNLASLIAAARQAQDNAKGPTTQSLTDAHVLLREADEYLSDEPDEDTGGSFAVNDLRKRIHRFLAGAITAATPGKAANE